MTFSTIRQWLAGGVLVVAAAGAAYAQTDPKVAFEARYAELTTAMLGKDTAKAGAIMAPEFESTDIRGETHTRTEALERMGQMPAEMAEVKPQTKVVAVKMNGDTAAVDSQMSMQMERPDDTGKTAKLEITMLASDTWVQRGGVWLLQKSVQKDMSISKDGEVVFHQAN
jgi:hypothetical protein